MRGLFMILIAGMLVRGEAAGQFDQKKALFTITFNGETSAYEDLSTFVMPGETLTIEADGPPGEYKFKAESGEFNNRSARVVSWIAPRAPGMYLIEIAPPGGQEDINLNVFVMVPATEIRNGYLNGYRIGEYPAKPLNGNPMYLPPRGFVEVTRKNADTKLTPHFKLKQFLCKEDLSDRYPKYVVLKERLLLKLEAILQYVNDEMRVKTDTLHVMSAYRTPYYNKAIGDVLYSQHQWGAAADIFIDPHDKGRMEDLDGDHVVDILDAKYLYDRIEELLALKPLQRFQGGMGFYPATSAHPPFVHVDVRGTKARWKG